MEGFIVKPFRIFRLCSSGAALVAGLLAAGPRQALAQNPDFRDPSKAPPSWIQFAKLVKYRFEEWIATDDTSALRFRAYLKIHRGASDGPRPPDSSARDCSVPG